MYTLLLSIPIITATLAVAIFRWSFHGIFHNEDSVQPKESHAHYFPIIGGNKDKEGVTPISGGFFSHDKKNAEIIDDHVRSLAESMEESTVLKFQHPLEVVLDNDNVLLDLPPLSHLLATATASILCGQHRHLVYMLFLRKQIFASSAGEYTLPLDVPDCVALNHPDATWPCVVYSHGEILHYDWGPSPHFDILSYPLRTFAR